MCVCTYMYHHQQNKCYSQRCLHAYFKATLDFSRSEFHYNVLLKLNAVFLTPLGVTVIFCCEGTNIYIYIMILINS